MPTQPKFQKPQQFKNMKIAFIGLGIMGSRMAANLLKGGHELIVHNRTKARAKGLVEMGADWSETPAGAAQKADVVITMLKDPGAVTCMAVEECGFLPIMKKGSIWIDSSTVNPTFSLRMSKLAEERKIKFLDAPVSGSKEPAANGELTFLVGGAEKDFNKVEGLLGLMGKKAIYVGGHGKGSAMKIMINQLLGQSMLAFSESLSLGMAMGIEKSLAMDILLDSPVTPPILKAFRSRIEEENYEPNFPLKHLHKDLNLFTQTAYEYNQPAPLTSAAKEVYALAKQAGYKEEDFAAVFKLFTK